jgi:F0F1-type ATP synthase assembly protein I
MKGTKGYKLSLAIAAGLISIGLVLAIHSVLAAFEAAAIKGDASPAIVVAVPWYLIVLPALGLVLAIVTFVRGRNQKRESSSSEEC